MKTTLKDIAKKCNLDISTVSRALSGDERVKPETKKYVSKISKQLNYKPNLAARSLAAGRTKTICLMLGSLEGALERRAASYGSSYISSKNFDLYITLYNSDPKVYERQFERISLGLTDGAIISPNRQINSLKLYKNCIKDNIPIVFFDQHFEELKAPVVTSDNQKAVQTLIKECLNDGVKKFYVILGEHNSVEKLRYKSSVQYLKRYKIPFELISPSEVDTKKIGKIKERTIGILCTSQGTLSNFYQSNLDQFKNKNIYFACFDNWIGSCFPARKVIYAVQNYERMISIAIDKIVEYTDTKKKIKSEIIKVPILEFKTVNS